MIVPGDAIIGLDMGGHIWVVLSHPNVDGEIAIVSLSKHGRPKYADHSRCTVVQQAEYPELYSDSCVMPRQANLNPLAPLLADQAKENLAQRDSVSPAILLRIQRAVLGSRFAPSPVRDAISATIDAASQ